MTAALPQINPHLVDTGTPPIPEAQAWLAGYDGRHGPPINLSQAVPGSPPPPELLERLGAAAASADAAKYGPIHGDMALVAAYAAHVGEIYGADIGAPEIAITAGCNEAFFVTALAVANAGEAVLLPAPWYFNHAMTLRMLGIKALPLQCRAEHRFVPDPEEARQVLRDHRRASPDIPVRAIVLVTPNNPTGAVIPPGILAKFAALALETNTWLVLDETYRDFLPAAEPRPHGLFATPEHRQRLIQLYSFSKAYCMPGHRAGAMIAPAAAMAEVTKVLDCIQICAPRAAQAALAWAIPALAAWRRATADQVNRRAELFRAGLMDAPDWQLQSMGAYFAYLAHPYQGRDASCVARTLASGHGILALPGSYFGPGQAASLRFAFANVSDDVASGVGARLCGALPPR